MNTSPGIEPRKRTGAFYLMISVLIFMESAGAFGQDSTLVFLKTQAVDVMDWGESVWVPSDSVQPAIDRMLTDWRNAGHLGCSIESAEGMGTDSLSYALYRGPKLYWDALTWAPSSAGRFRNITFRNPPPLSQADYAARIGDALKAMDHAGFPFARIEAHPATVNDSTLSIGLALNPGPAVQFDTVILKSNSLERPATVARLLGVRKGDPYSGKLIDAARVLLGGTGFLTVPRKPAVLFTPDGAALFVYAEKKKSSSVNGVLGFQPAPDGSISFTGQLDLELRNALQRAERFELHWRRLQTESQQFDVLLDWPFVLNARIGIRSELQIFRQDSTFATLFFRNGVSFPVGRFLRGSAFVESRSSNELRTLDASDNRSLNTRYYGLQMTGSKSDNPFNPTEGILLDASLAFGRKDLASTSEQPAESAGNQGLLETDIGMFLSWRERWVIFPRLQFGGLLADALYISEFWPLGGLRTLRGFDEGQLRASAFGLGSFELRFLLDEQSHLLAFVDGGWYEQRSVTGYFQDRPLGIGAGLRFATGNGQFSLIYGLGKGMDAPFQLATGKVHFGFVSYF